jgi:hypothetical protein
MPHLPHRQMLQEHWGSKIAQESRTTPIQERRGLKAQQPHHTQNVETQQRHQTQNVETLVITTDSKRADTSRKPGT